MNKTSKFHRETQNNSAFKIQHTYKQIEIMFNTERKMCTRNKLIFVDDPVKSGPAEECGGPTPHCRAMLRTDTSLYRSVEN